MKIKYKGRDAEATEVNVLSSKEDWNEYQLSDGTIIKFKLVLNDIYRVVGETDDKGNPVYHWNSTNLAYIKLSK